MQPDLLPALLTQWPDELLDHSSFEVGLSGGLDSMVLLDLMARARCHHTFSLSAVHIHHGLSAYADHWVQCCQKICEQLGVGLRVASVCVRRSGGGGLEAEARKERYQVYAATTAQALVLAQHQDDQAETVLLQLLRGGGVRALAAMSVLRPWQGKWLWRPLLMWPRIALDTYARWRNLIWVDDESNADTHRRRNLLRHNILPQLAAAIPDYRFHLVRSAGLMAEAADILSEVMRQDLLDCSLSDKYLDLPRFLCLSSARQRQLLVFWISEQGFAASTPNAIETFRQQIATAAPDRNPMLILKNGRLFRYRKQLVLCQIPQRSPMPVLLNWPWLDGSPSGWLGTLRFVRQLGGIDSLLLVAGFTLMARTGGERLLTKIGKKSVKTLLQEHGVPPALRAGWPLLILPNGHLAALPGIAVAEDCQATGEGWWPCWRLL